MLVESATVLALDGDYALVEAQRRSVCGGCAIRSGCGTGALSEWFSRRPSRVKAHNAIGARVGDSVQIGIPERFLLGGSIAVYAVPLVLMLLFAVASAELLVEESGRDLAGILGGALGLAVGFVWLRWFARRALRTPAHQPTILRVLVGTGVEVLPR
jgi:sigma-E factor negative regulatory protein RseC